MSGIVRRGAIAFAALLLSVVCAAPAAAVETSRARNGMLFEHGDLHLLITDRLDAVPSLVKDGAPLSLVEPRTAGRPSFFIEVGGLEITAFRADWNSLRSEPVDGGGLGPGTRYTLTAWAEQFGARLYAPIRIEARVSLTFYDDFPRSVVTRATFTNRGEQRLAVDRLVQNHLRLDRRIVDAEAEPWDFASYQGAATRWGWDYSLIPLTADFDRSNFMGMTELASREVAGGGTPLVDIWAPEMGIAVSSAETRQEWISLPVRTGVDGLVEMSIQWSPDERLGQSGFLAPGDSVSTIRGTITVHELDFFDPLRTYSDMLRGRGVDIPLTSPRQVFEPYWKSWGLRKDFTLEEIFTSLEELRDVGIDWANLDDGWFTWYGDWDPNPAPGKFPGGESDMVEFVDSLHRSGFKSSLWWYPQGVSAESDLAAEHPEWLVQNEDGSLPFSRRGLYYLCPVYQPCIDFIVGQVRRIMGDWGYDGLYIDTQDLTATPPCFNPAHNHDSPLESFRGQPKFYRAIYEAATEISPDAPVEMCICAMPHDPFKMPYYNVANASDPINLLQTRRRVKVEKAYRGDSFAVGDCYQVPMDEWEGFSVPESFQSAVGAGAQVTTFFTDLTPQQEDTWRTWIAKYRELGLAWNEYLNLYDIAFDEPEGHVVRKGDRLYYGFFARHWSVGRPIELRGLEPGRTYRLREYDLGEDLGTVSAGDPVIYRGFRDHLLIEAVPVD